MKVSVNKCWIITSSLAPNKKAKKIPLDLPKTEENIYLDIEEAKREVDKLNNNNFNLVYKVESLNEYLQNIQDDAYGDGQTDSQLYKYNMHSF